MADNMNVTVRDPLAPRRQMPPIVIGRAGEYGATTVTFDLRGFIDRYGAGVPTLLHKRPPDDEAYIVPLSAADTETHDRTEMPDSETLVWHVGQVATSYVGNGKIELQWHPEGAAKKSAQFDVVVLGTIGNPVSEIPNAQQIYLDVMQGIADDAETAAARACAAADAAEETARGALRYDAAQTLSDAQKEQARLNIDAVSENTFSTLEMDVENVKTAAYAHIRDASAHVSAADRARWNAGGGSAANAVLYTPQSLTPAQQAQARGNIGAGTYTKPSGGIPDSDIASATTWNAKGTYSKPASGIPASDLAAGVIPDISGKANAADVYTKTEVDQKLVGAMDYKGTKATVSELPTSGNATGDVWHIDADGSEWAWNGSTWEELGSAVDLSGYATEQWVEDKGYLTQHQSLAAYRTSAAQDTIDAAQDTAIAAKYTKPSTGIPKTDLASDVKASLGKADTALQEHQSLAAYRTASAQDAIDTAQNTEIASKYTKPNGGIPKADLAAAVQTSLGKADTALQSAPVTSVNTKTGAVVLSASDVGALPSSTSIPAKASDLTNDIGYQTEQDVQAAISGVRQIPTFPSIADIAELWHSVSKLPSGAWEDYAWHQCPEAVRNYLANVDYTGVAYTESSIGNYAPTPAVPATNTKPIGQTVDGVTFYNIRPNSNAPYATANKSGVLNPLDQVRWINTAATNNFRDLGGWPCDGGSVKYGLLYRSGNLGAADEDLIVNRLGITVECDLTADGEPAYPDKMRFIGYTSYAMYTLANTGAWQTNLRGIFDAVKCGDPVVFHCSMGADRTGTLACILEGLLGVSQSDIDKDYELTSFYAERARNGNYQGGTTDWAHLIAQILALEGDTFRDKCVTFVRGLGFTVAEINEYRHAMIDGDPEDIEAPSTTYTVTNTLTGCTTNNHSSSADGGGVYAATITANSGYTLTGATVSITMGGTDITASAYSNGTISIANVTGNIVIQISAVAESRLKELFDPSAATLNQRFNSSGGYTALNGNFCTDFIPVSGLNTSEPWRIHIKDTTDATRFQYGGQQESIVYFKADKSIMNTSYGRLAILTTSGTATVRKDDDQDGGTHIDINKTGDGNQIPSTFFDLSQVAYIRVCMIYSRGTAIPDTATLANVSITADKITN